MLFLSTTTLRRFRRAGCSFRACLYSSYQALHSLATHLASSGMDEFRSKPALTVVVALWLALLSVRRERLSLRRIILWN
jgi:hypothetical protein